MSEARNADPITAAFELLQEGEVSVVLTSMCDSDVDTIAAGEFISVASDGMSLRTEGPLSAGKPHPRSYGTNARFIERMVLERNVVGLEEDELFFAFEEAAEQFPATLQALLG